MDFIKSIQGWEYAVIVAIVVASSLIKGFVPLKGKYKKLYMLLPFLFSFIISASIFLFLGIEKSYIIEKGFLWGAGSLFLYDVVIANVKDLNKKKDNEIDGENEKNN